MKAEADKAAEEAAKEAARQERDAKNAKEEAQRLKALAQQQRLEAKNASDYFTKVFEHAQKAMEEEATITERMKKLARMKSLRRDREAKLETLDADVSDDDVWTNVESIGALIAEAKDLSVWGSYSNASPPSTLVSHYRSREGQQTIEHSKQDIYNIAK